MKAATCARLSILLLAAIHVIASPGRADGPMLDLAALEQTALDELRDTHTPGVAVAIVVGDRVVFARGFGVANVETGALVTPDLLFRLGSTTKMFTAAALVKLSEDGKLKLDEPVGNVVKGLAPRIAKLTPNQLLSHTAGLPTGATWYGPHDEDALGKTVRSWKDDFLVHDAGTKFLYSNPSYWLAGLAIEEAYGKSYADAVSELLLQPLGMKRSTFRPTMAMTYPFSQGHEVREAQPRVVRPLADNASSWPAGSLFSSVDELSRFAIAFLNGGRLDGKQVLSTTLIETLASAHSTPAGNVGQYGYGLHVRKWHGERLLDHGGNRLGFGSQIKMLPESRCAVIVVTNRTGSTLPRTAEKALELVRLPAK